MLLLLSRCWTTKVMTIVVVFFFKVIRMMITIWTTTKGAPMTMSSGTSLRPPHQYLKNRFRWTSNIFFLLQRHRQERTMQGNLIMLVIGGWIVLLQRFENITSPIRMDVLRWSFANCFVSCLFFFLIWWQCRKKGGGTTGHQQKSMPQDFWSPTWNSSF